MKVYSSRKLDFTLQFFQNQDNIKQAADFISKTARILVKLQQYVWINFLKLKTGLI